MTVIETNLPTLRSTRSLWQGIRQKLASMLKLMQYSRMVSTLANLTDTQLAQIGIKRHDIPARAHAYIYETEAKTPKTGA